MNRIYAIAVVLLLIAGCAWWLHHAGYESGKAADQAVIDQKSAALLAAGQSLSNAAQALRESSAATQANAAAALAAEAKADASAADARRKKQEMAAADAEWKRKFNQAKQSKDCQYLLERMLCPAVAGY